MPNTTKIKICGTTSLKDALMCAEAGADALGFIFAPISKRLVKPQEARKASLSLPPTIARVGVFMNQPLDEVLRLAEASRMTAVQLHGDLSQGYIDAVAQFYPVIKAIKPSELGSVQAGATLMLDAPVPGGGVPIDWHSIELPPSAWLAGGLGADNVQEAISVLSPALVDAVSKLETSYGVKSPQAVAEFVQAVRGS